MSGEDRGTAAGEMVVWRSFLHADDMPPRTASEVDLALEGKRDEAAEGWIDGAGVVLEGDALVGARLVLLVTLWNRWVREQVSPGWSLGIDGRFCGREGEDVPQRLSALFSERADLARGALDFAELLGAVCTDGRVRLPRGTVLDRFVAATFPEGHRGWPWSFLVREVPP